VYIDPNDYRYVTIPVTDTRETHRSSRFEGIAVHGADGHGTELAARDDPINGHRRDQPSVEILMYRSARCSCDSLIQRGTLSRSLVYSSWWHYFSTDNFENVFKWVILRVRVAEIKTSWTLFSLLA
jgi:hypothetical protein